MKAVLFVDGVKPCGRCRESLPPSRFDLSKRSLCGYSSWCKDCDREKARRHAASLTPEERNRRRRIYEKTYRERNPERYKDGLRRQRLKKLYQMTDRQYFDLLASQGGGCAICGGPSDAKDFAVDHDHSCCPGRTSCGRCIRGVLCSQCNTALGLFRDDPALMARATDYLGGVR